MPERAVERPFAVSVRHLVIAVLMFWSTGCHTTAPIYTWHPPEIPSSLTSRVAVAPLAGDMQIAGGIEQQIMAQRPAARADMQVITASQLARKSPIRLASLSSLNSDLTAMSAARAADADLLLHGEILSADLHQDSEQLESETTNFNELFFQRTADQEEQPPERLLLSWRIFDVHSGMMLGNRTVALDTDEALAEYPDLSMAYHDKTDALLAACARETWQSIAPAVQRESAILVRSWLQPGGWRVRRGVAAAKRGRWDIAEDQFRRAATFNPFNAAAQHNLALALAAREDFVAAKQTLAKARGLTAVNLPDETLWWLETQHRQYNAAMGLAPPDTVWAAAEEANGDPLVLAPPIDIDQLPWWTAIPFVKPPEWTWKQWLTQPILP